VIEAVGAVQELQLLVPLPAYTRSKEGGRDGRREGGKEKRRMTDKYHKC
jgi:hypothetical protein